MSQTYNTVTVTGTATLIVAENNARRNLSIVNYSDTTIVFIGPDSDVTAANGLPLYQAQTRDQDKVPEGYAGPIYGITSSGTADLRYWENANVG